MRQMRKDEVILSLNNCPVCLVGVVDPFGYIELKEGQLDPKISF